MLECANQNTSVLKRPAPNVIFMAFGESSLDFELRVFIRDIDYVFVVASELRYAIFKALAEAGIEIPFPQRDVHIKAPQEPGHAAGLVAGAARIGGGLIRDRVGDLRRGESLLGGEVSRDVSHVPLGERSSQTFHNGVVSLT